MFCEISFRLVVRHQFSQRWVRPSHTVLSYFNLKLQRNVTNRCQKSDINREFDRDQNYHFMISKAGLLFTVLQTFYGKLFRLVLDTCQQFYMKFQFC